MAGIFRAMVRYGTILSILQKSQAAFPRVTFRKTKGAIKLLTGLDADGYLPEIMNMTNGKTHEIQWVRVLQFF